MGFFPICFSLFFLSHLFGGTIILFQIWETRGRNYLFFRKEKSSLPTASEILPYLLFLGVGNWITQGERKYSNNLGDEKIGTRCRGGVGDVNARRLWALLLRAGRVAMRKKKLFFPFIFPFFPGKHGLCVRTFRGWWPWGFVVTKHVLWDSSPSSSSSSSSTSCRVPHSEKKNWKREEEEIGIRLGKKKGEKSEMLLGRK